MKRILSWLICLGLGLTACPAAFAADTVPHEVQMPGTQPLEVGSFESPDKCDNCHANYNDALTAAAGQGEPQDEPTRGWRGGAMGNAGRDPIFWATLAVAERDFDGAGDLCIRCHSTAGWYGGRSTPTDGSGLAVTDSNGVDCDACHTMTNPDDSEHVGIMQSPFVANCTPDINVPDKTCPSESDGFYGSGMLSLWSGSDKLGPYEDAEARHQFMASDFHRDTDFCGSCHDVSNPVVGDLAPGNGAQAGAPAVVSSQTANGGLPNLGGPVEEKAAFNNPPYAYGVVERTFSEYKASAFPVTRVRDLANMPEDLRTPNGAIAVTHEAALMAGTGGDYADGDPRYFSCQSCHMRPVNSAGADKNGLPIRPDLPRHDQTGANYWLVDMVRYLDGRNELILGGNMTAEQFGAMEEGRLRATAHLDQAARLELDGDTLKVINLTGHKLITGYPEGRRMWLNIRWYGASGEVLREDGAYGPLFDESGQPVRIENPLDDSLVQVKSILDLENPNLRIYEALYAVSQEWAETLLAAGLSPDLTLDYDRTSGAEGLSLGELAAAQSGTYRKTFHFVLNNLLVSDTRIPPWGMQYDAAQIRNVLPVPDTQYGDPGPGGAFRYWDEVDLASLAPTGAVAADIDLLYQGTSWEYIQFLSEADDSEGFLGDATDYMLEAWLNAEVPVAQEVAGNRKMVPPYRMASTTWSRTSSDCSYTLSQPNGGENWIAGQTYSISWSASGSGCANTVSLALHRSGSYLQTISNGTSDTNSAWTIPVDLVMGFDYTVKAVDLINPAFTAESAKPFVINDPYCNTQIVPTTNEPAAMSYEACDALIVPPGFIGANGASIRLSSGRNVKFGAGVIIEKGAAVETTVCGQSLCQAGPAPMPQGCHSCVDQICAADASCCSLDWGQKCVDQIATQCGLICE